jgi:predicted transposase/invertase (TIGR01784 family)
MQSANTRATRSRFLYYWAKGFSDSLATGDVYTSLRPCFSIVWFKDAKLLKSGFHSVFHLSEDHSREVFAEEIEFHVLELPKLRLAGGGPGARLERWARFLRAASDEEVETLSREDATMNTAKNVLEALSADPDAQRLAREREMAELMHGHMMASSFEEGEAKGLVVAVRSLCNVLGIDIDEQRSARLKVLDADELTALVEEITRERRWPEGL